MHFNNLAFVGLVGSAAAAPLGTLNHEKRLMCAEGTPDCGKGTIWDTKPQFGIPPPNVINKRLSTPPLDPLGPLRGDENSICDAIGGCDGNLETAQKRSLRLGRPFGDDQSFCDAIGGCDGNLETPQKRAEELEKRDPQAELCVMPFGCNDNEHELPSRFRDFGPVVTREEKRQEEKHEEEEKRDPQYELCVMPFGCNDNEHELPSRFRDGILPVLPSEEKRSPSELLSINVGDLPKVQVGDLIGIGPQVNDEEKRDPQLVEACVMPYGCNGDPNDGPGRFPVFNPETSRKFPGGIIGEEKRSPSDTLTVDVDELDTVNPENVIGIGPQISEEKRDPQFAEACVMPYGCNGDPNDGPGRFPKFDPETRRKFPGVIIGEEKRSDSAKVSVNFDDLVDFSGLTPDEICGFKGCGGIVSE